MDLFYREYGKGQPLILLHGILGISDNWVTFARRISHLGFRCLIPDQRNHGHSPHHRILNYYALTDDLAEFISRHGLEDPIILGHSMGGKLAMRYTLENPAKVDKLIVVDTSLRTYVRFHYHQQLIDTMLSVDFDTVHSRQEVEDHISSRIDDERLVQFLLKNLFWIDKTRLAWRPDLIAIYDNLENMYDGVFFTTRFERPALFVRGGMSDYILDQDFPAIYTNFPAARVETIESGTHWVHADDPEGFFNLVSGFLSA
jgi:pimeloyl-ACP methyl ester carboxylesterase